MKLRSFSAVFGGIVALAAVACSSSSNSGTGDASTESGFIDQYCSYIASCCGTQNLPSDGKECHALFSLASGTYDPQKGQACIDSVKAAASASPAWCASQTSATSSACNGVIGGSSSSGSVQPGGACKADSDCAAAPAGDNVSCRTYFESNNTTTEICQVETHGKAGDGPCLGTVTVSGASTSTTYNDSSAPDGGAHPSQGVFCFTADGFTCSFASDTCTALGQIGDSCAGTQCIAGAHCDSLGTQTCVADLATGAACTQNSDCTTGDYCDSGTKTCTVSLGSGAACQSSEQCQSLSCSNGKCGAGLGGLGLALFCGSSSGT